jgi:hypothetical protein
LAIGTPAQYIRGDGSLATFPTSYPVLPHEIGRASCRERVLSCV